MREEKKKENPSLKTRFKDIDAHDEKGVRIAESFQKQGIPT